jgi:hypothetical protein
LQATENGGGSETMLGIDLDDEVKKIPTLKPAAA